MMGSHLLKALMTCSLASMAYADVILVDNGKARAVIVVGDSPTRLARYAAEELRTQIEKTSGRRLAVIREKDLPAKEERSVILVGDSKLAASLGYETSKIEPESTIVKTIGNQLILIGGDRGDFDIRRYVNNATGTLYAVYDFLEHDLGVRWLWPGELGTVAPARKTIRIADTDRGYSPPLIQRNIRGGLRDWGGYAAKLGRTAKMTKRLRMDFATWARRRRLGRRAYSQFGHAYNHWLKKYGKEHPDWFAMMPDGKRVTPERPYPSLERAKLCVTNPQLQDFIAKKGMAYLAKNPDVLSFSVCPNDSRGYCMCPKCKALDHPDGIKDPVSYPGVGRMMYPSLSDRYVWFWNQIAKRMGNRFPGRGIGAYAYSNYRFPPLREKLSKRVIIAYVGFNYLNGAYTEQSRKDWAGWAKTGCKMYLRPNLLLVGHGYPLNYARELGKDIKQCFRTGMMGTDFDSMTHQYAAQGIIFYTLTSLLWNPEADVESIITEFLDAAYGPAAPVMRRYWDRLEKLTDSVRVKTDSSSKKAGHDHVLSFHDRVPDIYTDRLLGELRGILDEARRKAVDRPDVVKRIDFAGVGLEYAEIQRNALLAVGGYNRTSKGLPGLMKVLKRKQDFFRKHIADRTVGLWHVYWREARSTTHALMYGTLVSDAHLHPRRLAKLILWRFKTDPKNRGEALGYHRAGFDDGKWRTLSAMTFWERQGFKGYDGYGWYRRKLKVPAEWAKYKKIILRFGAVDESFWLYIDGKLVRNWMYDGVKDPRLWTKPRPVDITKYLRFGAEHTLAVKVHDSAGAGGFWKSVMVVYE